LTTRSGSDLAGGDIRNVAALVRFEVVCAPTGPDGITLIRSATPPKNR
jgi:hypothetical protein